MFYKHYPCFYYDVLYATCLRSLRAFILASPGTVPGPSSEQTGQKYLLNDNGLHGQQVHWDGRRQMHVDRALRWGGVRERVEGGSRHRQGRPGLGAMLFLFLLVAVTICWRWEGQVPREVEFGTSGKTYSSAPEMLLAWEQLE